MDFGKVPLDVEERRAYLNLLRRMRKPIHIAQREIVSAGMAAISDRYPERKPAAPEAPAELEEGEDHEGEGDEPGSESGETPRPRRKKKAKRH